MCSCFCTNTVDSLPQYTVTTTTTNDVLISSLRTEHTNELTETTTVSEFDITDRAEPFITTEINKIISSSVPTKMFKGDDYNFIKNLTSDKNVITTIVEPVSTDSVTTTEPSIKVFDEYTTNNMFTYSDEKRINENEIGSTYSGIDLDEIIKVTSSTSSEIVDDSTDVNENNEITTNANKLVTSKDESQFMSTVPSLANENESLAESSTQYFEPKPVEVTTLNDRNLEKITFDSNTETTSMSITTDSQTILNAITEDNKYLNTVNSTQLQDSFTISTFNPTDSTTNNFNDYESPNTIKTDDNSDRSTITESTPEQYIKNIETTIVPGDLPKPTTDKKFNTISPPVISNDFQASTSNDLINDFDVATINTIGTNDLNFMETTTLNIFKNPTKSNNNIEMTATVYNNDNTHTSTDKNILFNQDESTEGMNAKTFEVNLSFDTTTAILETTTNDFKSSTNQNVNRYPEVTTDGLNESMDSRTIYFGEENEINNNVLVTTISYSGISTNYNQKNTEKNPTEYSSSKTFEKTTIPTVFNDSTDVDNTSAFLTTTASDEFTITTSKTKNQEETILITPDNHADTTSNVDINEKKESTTKLNDLTTNYINLVKGSDRNSENDQIFTTKTSFNNDDVFIERTTALFDEEKEFQYSTTKSSFNPVEDVQTGTQGIFDDRTSTFISKTKGVIDTTTINYEDKKGTTLDTFVLNENTENDFTLHSIETTLQPIINKGAELTSLEDKFGKNVTTISVISTQSTDKNIEQSAVSTDNNNIEVMTVTAPNQVTNDFVNRPLNASKTDEMATIVPELTTQNIESSIVPGQVSINDSNISQDVKKKWEALFGTDSANNVSSANEPPTVVGIRFTTINGTEETIPNTEPTEAIVSKEIFTENYEVTDGSMNNAANGVEYDLTTTTTIRTRGKNESVITSTRVADRDDTISVSEISTMANEVTTRSDFERKNESIVSTRTQGDRTDKTEAGDDPTTEPFAPFNSVSSFETTINNIPTVTDSETSGIFTTAGTDVEYVNRDNIETTTVTIITMADWIKTKSTTLISSNEIVTDKNVKNRLDFPTETNTRRNVDSVTTEIPLEPIAKTNDLDQIETTSITSLSDASTMINLITTSIEVLVSNLSTENDSTTTEHVITTDPVTTRFYDSYSSTNITSLNKTSLDTPLNQNEMSNVTTTKNEINSVESTATTEQFTVSPTEETTYDFQTDSPNTIDFKNDLTTRDNMQDITDLNILTTTEYTITSKSIEVEDTTLKYTNLNQTNINNSYSVQEITTATRKWCWNDTDCDVDHKCLAAKCLPTGESRVNNCPPGIITLQCLKGIIYT